MKINRHIITGCLLTVTTVLGMAAVSAAPNPLLGVQTGNPDIFFRSGSGITGCDYDGANLSVTATPLTLTIVSGTLPDFVTGGTLTINAAIDASGVLSGGDVTVTGVAGAYASPLLTGSITSYGIGDLGLNDRVEFLFSVTGGSLAADMGGIGAEGGIIVSMEGSSYAGSFAGAFSCDIAKGNIGPTPNLPTGTGTGTIGYWKNHPEAWPIGSVTIGGQTFTKAEAIDILKVAVKGDKSISMAKQLIGAKINVAAGNDSSCISATIAAADQWLINHGGVGAGQRRWDDGDLLHDELDAYNNGLLCAPHRD